MHHYVINKAEKGEMGFQSIHFQAVLSLGKKAQYKLQTII